MRQKRRIATSLCSFGGACFLYWLLGWLWSLAEACGILPHAPEASAIWLSAIFTLVALTIAITGAAWRIRKRLTLRALASSYENATPQDANRLATVLELEVRDAASLRPFEASLLDNYQRFFAQDDFACLRNSSALRISRLERALQFALIPALILLLCATPPLQKRALTGLFSLTPGIEFEAFPHDLPVGSDLQLRVKFNRYPSEASEAVLEVRGQPALQMHPAGNAQAQLTLYELNDALALRVRSKNLSTAWQYVSVYTPPAPTRISISVTPPAYTDAPCQELSGLTDFSAPAGSLIAISCVMPSGQRYRILKSDSTTPITSPFVVTNDMSLQVEYSDRAGHVALSQPVAITVTPDLPPVIEVASPQNDDTLYPDTPLQIDAKAIDDYGLEEFALHLIINDQPEQCVQFALTSPREANAEQEYPLPNLTTGSVITGYFSARDNRRPTPQQSRSDLFFVTIIPERPENDASSSEENADELRKNSKEANISDLIVECKRLLRNTSDLQYREETPSVRILQELERDLRTLELSIRSRAVAIAQNAHVKALPEALNRYFTESGAALLHAAQLVSAGALRDSLKFEHHALLKLTELNNILLENLLKMQAGAGSSGEQSESSGGQQGEEQSQQNAQQKPSGGDRANDLKLLREAREELRSLLDNENKIIGELRRNDRPSSTLASPQQQLAEQCYALQSRLGALAQCAPMRSLLREATDAMKNAAQACTTGQGKQALPPASRSAKLLRQSLVLADELLNQEHQRQAEYLAQEARQLSEQQKSQAQNSQSLASRAKQVSQEEQQLAKNAQKSLNERAKSLQQQLEELAQQLENNNPTGAAALRQTMLSTQAQQLSRSQQRAANALLYRRYDAAAKTQSELAKQLSEWAERLNAATTALTERSEDALRNALALLEMLEEELQQSADANDPEAMSAREQLSDNLKNTLQQLANDLALPGLNKISDAIGTDYSQESLEAALKQANTILREELAKLKGDSAAPQEYRFTTPPPAKYRIPVREYFRELSK